MPRANRLAEQGGIFHVTHRCHNRDFLLKFARDRNAYREKMREHLPEFDLAVLDYCITSNHVHLLIDASERLAISGFMRQVAGELARIYNRRKERQNAFWGDNFHATLVEGGEYLWRCLSYIELNMVRCGVVEHPSQWEWQGYREIMGKRRRYRLLDLERLSWRLQTDKLEDIQRNLEESLRERIEREEMSREEHWTETLAVGSRGFVERIQPLIRSRRETEVVAGPSSLWVLKEEPISYGQNPALKIGCKA